MLDFPRFYPDQVVPPERFGDRTDQLRQIEFTLQAIRESRPRGAMVCGERGIGKTSLLHKAEAMCLERKSLPLHIALHEFADVREFYDTIFEEVGSALKNIGLWEKLRVELGEFEKGWDYVIRLRKRPKTMQAEVHERLALLLEKMTRKGHQSLVFFLDESDGLKAHVVGLQILRNVWTSLAQRGHRLGFFFAGSENLVESLGRYSPLKRHCIPVQLKRFKMDECLEVMARLEEGAERKLPPSIRTRIAELSGGYPHYLHVLGSHAVEAMRKGKQDVWAEAFRSYLIETNTYESVATRAAHVSDTQKRILAHMDFLGPTTPKRIAQGSGVAQATIPTHLQRLVQSKIVRKAGRAEYEIADRDLAEHVRLSMLKTDGA
ncbi:MAG: ATP-binding protein [Elusimicrobia bacterium]|nr:ATP-binding protein [Elusimicrobiota bacterium]